MNEGESLLFNRLYRMLFGKKKAANRQPFLMQENDEF